MKRIMIGTPAHDGRLEAYYVNSLIETIKLCKEHDIDCKPIFMSYDSLVQRARNDCIKMAVEHEYDALFFIDSDMIWNPEWVIELLNLPVDVISGTARKKTDNEITFAIHIKQDYENAKRLEENSDVMEVESTGMAFTKLTHKACKTVWNKSQPYTNGERRSRMVFDIGIDENGELYSEDTSFCKKWKESGGITWVATHMTCGHIGSKIFNGDFKSYFEEFRKQNESVN